MFTCILALFETNKCLIVPLCSLPKAATNVTFLGSIRYSRKMRRQPSAKNRCHSSFPLQYFTPGEEKEKDRTKTNLAPVTSKTLLKASRKNIEFQP